MAEDKMMRLSLVAKQINVGISTIVQYLSAKGHKVDNNQAFQKIYLSIILQLFYHPIIHSINIIQTQNVKLIILRSPFLLLVLYDERVPHY